MIAVADIAAGALVDIINNCSSNPNWNKENGMVVTENSKSKSDDIIIWLSETGSRLKKVNIVFDEGNISGIRIRKFDISKSKIII